MRILKIALLVFGLFSGVFAGDIRIFIIQGIDASAESYWYPWLKSELSSEIGKEIKAENISVPDMPKKAELQLWKDKIKEVVGIVDENTYFVTHGMGGIATLKYIEESGKKVGGVVLVSSYISSDTKNITAFENTQLDYKNLGDNIKHISVLATRDDKGAPYKLSEELAEKLGAKFILEQGGKIKSSNENKADYVSPRIIYSEIKLMINADLPKPKEDLKSKDDKK